MTAEKTIRRSVTLTSEIAVQVEAIASKRQLSESQVLQELIQQAIEMQSPNSELLVPQEVNARAIRGRLGLTRVEFANKFGLSIGTVKDWEIGRRKPRRPARVLLTMIDKDPAAVLANRTN